MLLMNITLVNSAWPTNKCFNLRFIFKYRYIFSKMNRNEEMGVGGTIIQYDFK